jgi:hypothetical protein
MISILWIKMMYLLSNSNIWLNSQLNWFENHEDSYILQNFFQLRGLFRSVHNLSWCLGSKPVPEYKLPDRWLDWSWWNTLWQKPICRQQTLQSSYINLLANLFHALSQTKNKPTWYTYIVCQMNKNHATLHQAEKPTYFLKSCQRLNEQLTHVCTCIHTTHTCLINHTCLLDTQTWQLKTKPAMWPIRTHEDSYILQNFFKLRGLFRSC